MLPLKRAGERLASTDVVENWAGHGVCGGGVGGGWSSGLSAKVELRRFSPDREGDR